ncbi:hypothetical protein ARMGADRAFT_948590 [Armillaria gallica]|uniref:Nephrocystin 3-like N-terminal domain-containing protein n=1 Tax=Armillaria gallica TaxID=47427 RepID=A0A2H3CH59_ARMGA|nr:hypothetical protein ARMGADRAFT_948590 [Armillaria gallica]
MHIITWLTDLNFKSVKAKKLSKWVKDTGCWFLESEQFQQWVDDSAAASCLWCPGNSGVGKTILATIIINYLQPVEYKDKTLVLSVFCDYQFVTTQTIANLLCSLLKQLIQGNGLSDPMTSLYGWCLHDQICPLSDTLTKILSQVLGSFDHVYIVLDALDKFTGGKPEELVKTIKSLSSNIHLLVTSRDIPKIGLLSKEDARLDI